MIEGSGRGCQAEALRRDGSGGLLVQCDVEQAGLGSSGEIRSASGTSGEAPARVHRAPLGGDLEGVAEGATSLNADGQILLEALGDALLVGPDIDRFAENPGARLKEESGWREEPVVFGGEVGHETDACSGTEFRAEAPEVLVDEAQVHLCTSDVGGLSCQIESDEQIGRPDGVFCETDQYACVWTCLVWIVEGACAGGSRAKGLIAGAVSAVGLDWLQGVESGSRRNGLAFEGLYVGEDLVLGSRVATFHINLAQEAGLCQTAEVAGDQVGFPALIVECVAEQGGAVCLGGHVARMDEIACFRVVSRGEAADGDADDNVGQDLCLLDVSH